MSSITLYVADASLRRGAVSCSSSLCSSGREAYPVSTSLGEVHHRCMGFVSNSRERNFLYYSFSVIEIELLLTEDGTSPCLRSET
jgi:hypothetical protein